MKPPLWTSKAIVAAGILFILAPANASADCIKDPLGWACKCSQNSNQQGCPEFIGPPNCADPAIANSPACGGGINSGQSICDINPCRIPCASAASPACQGIPTDVGGGDTALGKMDWTKFGLDPGQIAVLKQYSDWKAMPDKPGWVCNDHSCQNVGPAASLALGSHDNSNAFNAFNASAKSGNWCEQSPPPIPCEGAKNPNSRTACALDPSGPGCKSESGDKEKEQKKKKKSGTDDKQTPKIAGMSVDTNTDPNKLAGCLRDPASCGGQSEPENNLRTTSLPNDSSKTPPDNGGNQPADGKGVPTIQEKALPCGKLEQMGETGACEALAKQIVKELQMAQSGSIDVVFNEQVFRTVADTYDMFQVKDFRSDSSFGVARRNADVLRDRKDDSEPGFESESLARVGQQFDNTGRRSKLGGVNPCALGSIQGSKQLCADLK